MRLLVTGVSRKTAEDSYVSDMQTVLAVGTCVACSAVNIHRSVLECYTAYHCGGVATSGGWWVCSLDAAPLALLSRGGIAHVQVIQGPCFACICERASCT